MKLGIIDVGGGLRDIFGAGILDACLEKGIQFDFGIGVSAGSANLASFMSCQKGRNYRFYTQYAFRKEYMSLSNWIHTKSYINLDYVYGDLSNMHGEDPMDYDTFSRNPMELMVVATDAQTGRPHYFSKEEMPLNHYDILKASSCIPIVCKPYPVAGHLYFDGGLSDPVPIQKALDQGCDKIILILTKPRDLIRQPRKDYLASIGLQKKYPGSARSLRFRAATYNRSLEQAKALETAGKICILAPQIPKELKTLTKDLDVLDDLYKQGMEQIERIMDFLND